MKEKVALRSQKEVLGYRDYYPTSPFREFYGKLIIYNEKETSGC